MHKNDLYIKSDAIIKKIPFFAHKNYCTKVQESAFGSEARERGLKKESSSPCLYIKDKSLFLKTFRTMQVQNHNLFVRKVNFRDITL